MQSTARQIHEATTLEVRVVSVDFSAKLDSGETLTGTPTVTAPAAANLTLASKAVNSSTIVVNGVSLTAGLAIQFKATATSAVAGKYDIDLSCATTNGQTVHGRIVLVVNDD